jgi:DNA-binding NtrC family response regulator
LTTLRAADEDAKHPIMVDTAATAEHALRLIENTDYDTIVSDFCMPGLNGIDFLKACKTTRPNISVVLLTGYGTKELETEALKEGAYALVQKPVDADVFLSVVKRAILRREVRRAGLLDGQLFAAEKQRISSRLKKIDDRIRSRINDAAKDNTSSTSDPK